MLTLPLNKQLHALLNQTGLSGQKANLIHSFTNGRSTSSKDMSNLECHQLIAYLQGLPNDEQEAANRMRRKMLSYCHEMHWTVTNVYGKKIADVQRLDGWCEKFGYLHKKLNAYSHAELPKLVSQFERVYKDYLNKA